MPSEIEPDIPRTITGRLRDWVGDLVSLVEVAAAKVFSLGVASVATRQATELSEKTGRTLNDGLATAIKHHRQAKELISAEDQDELDLFEVFKGAALAQTRLMGEAIAQGISPQPIERAALERPTVTSLPSQAGSPSGGPRGEDRADPSPQPRPERAGSKKQPGRPKGAPRRDGLPRASTEGGRAPQQQAEQAQKRGRGRPRKNPDA